MITKVKADYDSVVVPSDVDLEALGRRLPARPRTRFAPAPTGWLHLGHVLNARYVWDVSRALAGQVLLRIEDHDRERCRPEFETGILDDLDWLGFDPDVFATNAFRAGRCEGRQSDREQIYLDAVGILRAQGLVYGCDCSRKDILETSAGREAADELWYPGTCRHRGLDLRSGVGWRVRSDTAASEPEQFPERFNDGASAPEIFNDGASAPEIFNDAMLGPQAQDPMAQCGDLLIRDRRGNWTYQFAVVVDDWRQAIDLVIRGRDLLASTGRQIRLARLLGRRQPPVFLHHPLIMKSADRKLSKSDRDTGVRDLRAAGWTREQVLAAAIRSVRLEKPDRRV
jgi:glutamyl-tRNA synthetase/glutamyl-Q tRNA(Asp) synthetase